MSPVEFEYRLTGIGWSEARLAIGPVVASLTASDLDDALGDLVRATLALARGAAEVRVSWAEEPGEFRWVLQARGAQVDVRVLWFDSDWNRLPDERGKVRLTATCDLRSFCQAIAAGTQAVLDQHGEVGYGKKWVLHDFPTEALRELQTAL
ncbi:hypothetical protein [Nocardioides humi]|uniref:Uncharacterized protein n=1 Tax=Nocardioides humi TaxID=449461 RepID=A0ABN2A2T9_9ACTN|nr:hypothetical protein [Nocardioides humi]